jgi:hypothetical protein
MRFQGHVENGRIVLDQPLPLPDGTPVRVEPITAAPTDFWQSRSLEELAKDQGVSIPGSPEEQLGGWPADELDDDFEEAFRGWRDRELELR